MLKTEIANFALGRLGTSLTINDLDLDVSNHAKILKRNFQFSLETFLERHPWSMFTQSSALALISEDVPRRTYVYEYPAGALTIQEIAENGAFSEYELYEEQKMNWEEVYDTSGQQIRCVLPLAHAKYTTRVSQDINFPTHFARGLAAQLALDAAPAIITNNFPKVIAGLMPKLENDISLAIAHDLGKQPLKKAAVTPLLATRWR